MAKSILMAGLDFSGVAEDEFHDWQDHEHIPERLKVPGFLTAERWIGADNPRISINTYDLDRVDVLKSAPYLAFSGANSSPWSKRIIARSKRLMRVVGDQLVPGDAVAPPQAQALLINALDVPPEAEADCIAWNREEHIPALARVPGVLLARFCRSADPASTQKFVSIYHLTAPEVAASAEWKQAIDTPWSAKMRPLFQNRVRIICRKYRRAA